MSEQFEIVKNLNLKQNNSGIWNLYVNGAWIKNRGRSVNLGRLDFDSQNEIKKNTDYIDCDKDVADNILYYIEQYLNENKPPNLSYIEWLNQKEADGIETILNQNDDNRECELTIGLYNDTIQQLGGLIGIKKNDNDEIIANGTRIVKAAYNFCDGENDDEIENRFIANLAYQFWRCKTTPFEYFYDFLSEIIGNEASFRGYFNENIDFYKISFWKIRNNLDTQKAIYRLTILGVVDDYTIDYAKDMAVLYFSKKEEGEYINNYKKYLNKYLGDESVAARILATKKSNEETELRKCTINLIEFFQETLTEKRFAAAKKMNDIIQDVYLKGEENGKRDLMEEIDFYFKSKYARQEYFVTDFKNNIESIQLFEKYLNFIKNPPDGLGKEFDNLQHLKGACSRYIISNEKNAIILLLNAFSTIALESKFISNPEIIIEKCKSELEEVQYAFGKLLKLNSDESVKNLADLFKNELIKINPIILKVNGCFF